MNGFPSIRRWIGIIVLLVLATMPLNEPASAQVVPDDTDNDLITNARDNCPDVANTAQIDTDDDGIGDACDDVNNIDGDEDFIPNDRDNCPDLANTGQIDRDGDGAGDTCDATPTGEDTTTDTTTDTDTDTTTTAGIPGDTGTGPVTLPDSDGDEVTDDQDSCPLDPDPEQVNTDGDQLGDVCDPTPNGETVPHDRDGDFVPDDNDNCPDTRNTTQLDQDGDGTGDACDDPSDTGGAITITKTAEAPVVGAGNPIRYTITVTNTGDSLGGAVVFDELPVGPDLRWRENSSGCQINDVATTPLLLCPAVLLGGGGSFSVTVTSDTTEASCADYTNTATARPFGSGVAITSNETSVTVTCETTLAITTTPDAGTVEVGTGATFTLAVTNTGLTDAMNVTITGALPPGFDWTANGDGFACGTSAGTLSCTLERLPEGESRSVTVHAATTIDTCGPVAIAATAGAFNADAVSDDGDITVLCPELTIAKTAVDPAIDLGEPLQYTITVTNVGDGVATSVQLTDTLPTTSTEGEHSLLDWTAMTPADGFDTCGVTGTEADTLTCTEAILPAGESRAVTVSQATTELDVCGEVVNDRATADADHVEALTSESATITVTCITPEEACAQEIIDAGITNPESYNVVAGTRNNDNFNADATTGSDLFCGLRGDDRIDTLPAGDVFLGGDGNDYEVFLEGGIFNGGADNDTVSILEGGIFNGGTGTDQVFELDGGEFNGGVGNDTLSESFSGTFNGGVGNDGMGILDGGIFNGDAGTDNVSFLVDGTFNGGDGADFVRDLNGGTFNGQGGDDSVINDGAGDFNPGPEP